MQVRMMGIVLSAIMLLALSPTTPVEAQEVPTPAGWEMGLVYEDGVSEDDPFTLEEDETSIRFWIRNDNLVGDIEISLDYDSSSDATLVGEESVTVGSGSNDTFSLKMKDIDVLCKAKSRRKEIVLGVDGGVNLTTIDRVYDTGVDVTVVGSGLYKAPDIIGRFKELENR